jgi:hypothetical protein
MRKKLDAESVDLKKVLDALLIEDIDITFREVARRHPTLKDASAFTRNSDRLKLIDKAIQRQSDARHVKTLPIANRAASLSEQLHDRNLRVTQLESQVKALVASHAACIRAVQLHGGVRALEKFWVDYKAIAETLREVNALPSGAEVIAISPNPRRARKRD